jgi:hypothetical protein
MSLSRPSKYRSTARLVVVLVSSGAVAPPSTFHDLQDAVRYQEQGHVPGKVIVTS